MLSSGSRLAALSVSVAALAAVPSPAHATDLMSEAGFRFDIQDGLGGAFGTDGSLSDGTADAYDGCYYLDVGGFRYSAGDPAMTSLGDRQIDLPESPVDVLSARRFVYVPSPGGSWARYLDVIGNPTSSPVTTTITISGNFGSDGSTMLHATSSGDLAVDTSDLWFATDDVDDGADPSLAHVLQGSGAAITPTTVSLSVDSLVYEWTVTIPAGGRVAFLTFAVQDQNQALVQAEASRLAELPDDAMVGLDAYLLDIVNWIAAPRCAGAPGSACDVGGRAGTCRAGRCCTGCFDGTRCHAGNTGAVCGANGGSCASCADADLCTSDVCTVGVCSNPFAPAGTRCEDPLYCTTRDVCDGAGTCAGTGPSPCDDGRACTIDSCDEAADSCGHVMGPGCIIGGECVPEGGVHPGYPCLVCDPAADPSDWTSRTGEVCGETRCVAARLRSSGVCAPTGLCVAPPTMRCASGACASETECVMACPAEGCGEDAYCAAIGGCMPLAAAGEACTASVGCATGRCVDGVCCESACTGVCESCAIAGYEGTCTLAEAGSDPDRECSAECDGTGRCAPFVRDAGISMPDAGSDADAGVALDAGGRLDGGIDAGVTEPAPSGCGVSGRGAAGPGPVLLALGTVLALLTRARRRRR